MTTPHGTDLWLRLGFGFVAILFIVSLPTWALGLTLVAGLGARAAINYLRAQDDDDDRREPPLPSRDDTR